SGVSGGQYLVWNLAGRVTIRVTLTAGPNALLSGIFFATPAAATFTRTDTAAQGSWKGLYGSVGEAIANDSASYPSYATVSFSGLSPFTWSASTSDVRAPQKAA